MDGGEENTELYGAIYRAVRDTIRATVRTAFHGVVLLSIGAFEVAIVGLTATAFLDGSATQATPFAGLFGFAATAFAGNDLYRRGTADRFSTGP